MLSGPVVVGIADMCMATNSVSVLTTYAAAFARAGNTPLVLPAETNRAVVARMLASVDVLLLCGGEDVEPRRYKTKPSPRLGEVNLRRDSWEFLLLDEAVKRSLPVIGICRGCQLINVYFGGTLWQDLPSERPGNVVHRGKDVVHDIQIVAGSRLAGRLGTGRLNVNSRHHQAVRDLAPGFRAVAFAPDGVVEAIEGDALPVVGVQFHPEKLFVLKDRDEFRVLFADPLGWARTGPLASRVGSCAPEGVKVSSFGFDAEDSTEIIQRALDSGARKLVFDRQSGPWITRPLVACSNQEIAFEDGVELVAKKGEFRGIRDYLFRCEGVSNLVIRGLGPKGGTFRMHKRDYQKPPYARSEWRYTLRLCGVENVHVENMRFVSSGGDGIVIGAFKGKSAKNVVIRNCVCDDNHRQGISLCGGEDILIENTVLSNTCGTPPQAGIDFEPDHPTEKLARITLRNVLSKDNAGSGFDFYFANMRDWSEPVSITLDNCRAEGNRTSVSLTADNKYDTGVVKGRVAFVNSVFSDARSRAVNVCGVPSGAVDVIFSDCVISNATPGAQTPDVALSAGTPRQGMPDGVTLKNLTVYQPTNRPWFAVGRSAFGPAPRQIVGDVTVVAPDGTRTNVVLDADWTAANFPVINGGRIPAPRVPLPAVRDVVVHDTCPGELVDLPPVALIEGGHYLLFVPKPGPVRLVARQIDAVGNRPANEKPTIVRYLPEQGGKRRTWKLSTPGFTPGELTFTAHAAGFYALELPRGGTRQQLLKSSVPVGVDVRESDRTVAGVKGAPVSLWFDVPEGKPFTCGAFGSDYYRFKASLVNPSGEIVASKDIVSGAFLVDAPRREGRAAARPPLWRIDFSRARQPHYDWIKVDLSGVPGCLFLTREKTWTAE